MHAKQRQILIIAGIIGFMVVALGAFGAHALKNALDESAQHQYDLAIRYAFMHAVALMASALIRPMVLHVERLDWAVRLFLLGIILFSGSLILLSLTDVRIFAFLTPVGGLSLLGGWLLFILSLLGTKP